MAKFAGARRRSSHIHVSTCAAAAVVVGALQCDPALADCQPNNPSPGGAVTCTDSDNDGYVAPGNTPVSVNVQSNASVNAAPSGFALDLNSNGNTVTLDGNLNAGISVAAGSLSFVNNGNINGGLTVTGTGSNSVTLTAGHNINNLATITGASNVIDTAASFNQGLVLNGSVSNHVTIRAGGFINQVFSITGAGQNTVINGSILNNGLTINGGATNSVDNQVGAQINQTFSITSDGRSTVNNAGIINNGLTFNGNGVNFLTNAAGATINQDVVSTGEARDTVDNSGLMNNSVLLNAGDDVVTNREGATINGVVNTGAGLDQFFMLGGVINNQVLMGDGDDRALWSGGNIRGGFDAGAGNDVATFRNLTPSNLTAGLRIDGGLNVDRLIWDNTAGDGVDRYVNWESFELTNNSRLTFSSTLTLGDSGTGTGVLSIDPTSTVFAGNGNHAVVPFNSALLASVINAGAIDLTSGPAAATDRLTIEGNYVGVGGTLRLHTVLDGDGSPSDVLAISRGTGTGSTTIGITNLNGQGALTTGNGILVVDATNGATTAAGAFALAGIVAAGPYEYWLFRGGLNGTAANSWFLRNSVPVPPDPPSPDVDPSPKPDPGPSPGPSPDPNPNPNPAPRPPNVVPIFRPEAALYTVLPGAARQVGLATLGTFHERFGEQFLLNGSGALPATWGRVFGRLAEERGSGLLSPEFKGSVGGIQAGQDIFSWSYKDGHQDRLGLFFGFARAQADARGNALLVQRALVGRLDMDATTLGGYWTHIGPSNWYIDAVMMASWLDGRPRSTRSVAIDAEGTALTASLEAGAPIPIGGAVTFEPQAQLIWQRVSFETARDPYATIRFDPSDALTARVGARLQTGFTLGGALLKPYLLANVWHTAPGTNTTTFNNFPLTTGFGRTTFEVGGGIAAQIRQQVAAYASGSYTTNLGGDYARGLKGNVGLRITW